jgi:aryl-alcohol dehydrogenase-like predicted oxidoreductase
MELRRLGGTGLEVSALGFGCGAVGGLLVKGEFRDMVQTIARAIELGVTYFDTAAIYGNGRSEASLGKVLGELRAEVLVGTKVRLRAEEMGDIRGAVFRSVEESLRRLRMECVDLIQLHNSVASARDPNRAWVSVDDVRTVARAFQYLQEQGKVRYWGVNGLGETPVLHEMVGTVGANSLQSCYNLLNPSAGLSVLEGFPFQDYGQLIDLAVENQTGVIAIRVLAAGALSGSAARHDNAAQAVDPIATNATFAQDVALAQRFEFLVQEGYADSLVEAAIRFSVGAPGISTVLVGLSNLDQLEQAVAAAERGPLPAEAAERLNQTWASL